MGILYRGCSSRYRLMMLCDVPPFSYTAVSLR